MTTQQRLEVGDSFHCAKCGMQIEITAPCNSESGQPVFQCCGSEMLPGGDAANGETLAPEAARGDYTA